MKHYTCAETAKLVRQALKANFPQVRFSVRSNTYSGGASIDVHWTDGPTEDQVDAVAGRYEGAGFDGMIDLKYSCYHYELPDGSIQFASTPGTSGSMGLVDAVNNPQPINAVKVHFGANYVQCSRTLSEALVRRVAPAVCAKWGLPEPSIIHYAHGGFDLSHDGPRVNDWSYDTARDMVLREARITVG